jgi:excisionase family DNA binding protein
MTPTELAAEWAVTTSLLYRWIRERTLAPPVVVRLGRLIRFNRAEIEKAEASGGLPLPGGWRKEATVATPPQARR